jgi:hypothetical protein
MAKKKKKVSATKSQNIRKRVLNKTFIDTANATVKKILRAFDIDAELFDQLSKNQRAHFIQAETYAPKFEIDDGSRIPRQLMDAISRSTHHFLRHNYFDAPSNELTYLDMVTFGIAFYLGFIEILDLRTLGPIGTHVRKSVQMMSKVNFRIYGFNWDIPSSYGQGYYKTTIMLYSEKSEYIYFQYKNKYHKAFPVRAGRVHAMPFHAAHIDKWFIIPEKYRHESKPKYLDIYIQSHALQRIKERVDIFPAHKRNFYVMDPLLYMHQLVFNSHDRAMFECFHKDTLFGYYPFIV